ncbi:sigma-54-dependent transcriptional regulator [Chryseolinea lacunae]|uniref:Sigma-54-dependent Fis family transcriptional regulator n=1 Tax=Chryseolinea lacunae TaxID=2801331 RepID=A0ABS1KWJ8_9BACT|nr:sigma-54 dependent transcriptional regulator [Chryseolinea lacunae]MBL0742686.1 sigma-54-dependent Fis family transcriptional regulator [Chryseolinea lacunae]
MHTESKKILIVEDQFVEANNLQMILERAGYSVCSIARSVPIALEIVASEKPDLVLLDIFLRGPLTGIDLAVKLNERNIAFVYLSANSNRETLESAKATRPYGFLVKPFRETDVLVMLEIAWYLHQHSLEAMMRNTENPLRPTEPSEGIPRPGNFYGIIGKSPRLQTVLNNLRIVAPTDTSVLVLGESGTGKERIAECIHELSPRRAKPLIKVNCAALPANLVESVLFGHEKGSFTGATERRIGKFEQAHGGTIFLDEIGEIPLEVQVKLLRVLQEKEIDRIGSTDTIKVDVRIVAATNRNLEREVAEGRFRMDFYYRLNVFPLLLPPLRERREDIPLLVQHFIEYYSAKNGKLIEPLAHDLTTELINYAWPGNVRELAHTMERSILLTEGKKIREVFLPGMNPTSGGDKQQVKTMLENERDHIIAVLRKSEGKIFGKGGAAEMLGMNSSTLNSRIKKLGIEKETIFKKS